MLLFTDQERATAITVPSEKPPIPKPFIFSPLKICEYFIKNKLKIKGFFKQINII